MTTPANPVDPGLRLAPAGDDIAARVVGDEAIIIDFASGRYYALDGAGVELWTLLAAGATVGEAARRLAPLYDAAPDVVEADVLAVCAELVAAGVVRADDGPAAPTQAVPPPEDGARRPYARPTLSRYDDLAEVFAVDPPLMMGRDPR